MAAAQLIHAWCAGWQKSTTESQPFKARPEVLVVTEWHRHSSTVPRRRCGQRSESRWSPAEQKSLCWRGWGGVACGRHAVGSVCLKMCTRSAGYGQTLCQCTLLCNRCDSSVCLFFSRQGFDCAANWGVFWCPMQTGFVKRLKKRKKTRRGEKHQCPHCNIIVTIRWWYITTGYPGCPAIHIVIFDSWRIFALWIFFFFSPRRENWTWTNN